MKKLILSFFILLGCSHSEACQIIEESFQADWTEHYLVILPKNYQKNLHYGAVYFLHGRGGDRHLVQGLGFCEQMDLLVDQGRTPFVVIAPDGKNSYWVNGALTHERWADMVTKSLIQDAQKKYSLISNSSARVVAGISMGGHGAIQLSLNYPGIFGAIGAHSPVFRTQEEASRDFYDEFGTGNDYQSRDPFSLIKFKGKRIVTPIYMDMGGQDVWLANTKRFADFLQSLHIPGDYRVGDDSIGAHELGYWQYHLPQYLNWYSSHLPRPH
jgi:S-formylglutathione hydrolase FrmB